MRIAYSFGKNDNIFISIGQSQLKHQKNLKNKN